VYLVRISAVPAQQAACRGLRNPRRRTCIPARGFVNNLTGPSSFPRRTRGDAARDDSDLRGHQPLVLAPVDVHRPASALRVTCEEPAATSAAPSFREKNPGEQTGGDRLGQREKAPCPALSLARPRGFEPLTFGSVDRRSRALLALASHFDHSDAPEMRQKIGTAASSTGATALEGGTLAPRGVATPRRSPPPRNPLPHRDTCSAPDRIRTCDLRFRSLAL